jgi:hypothetical protein
LSTQGHVDIDANSNKRIRHRVLRDALNPINADKCPTTGQVIQVTEEEGEAKTLNTNGWDMEGSMPAADADDYNCKVKIVADPSVFGTGRP